MAKSSFNGNLLIVGAAKGGTGIEKSYISKMGFPQGRI
jgi:hypothetical protein